jgi:hypothetical protein
LIDKLVWAVVGYLIRSDFVRSQFRWIFGTISYLSFSSYEQLHFNGRDYQKSWTPVHRR